MSGSDTALNARFHLIAVYLLVIGLPAAAAVFVRTGAPGGNGAADYAAVGEHSYSSNPVETKRDDYEMERIGGKSNLLAADIRDWFDGLWHGRRLAYTLAFLSVGGSGVCFFLAYFVTFPPPLDDGTDKGDGT
jgi:hypothetical protein